ncbi:sugar ABC transporter substrate-binding protein [candidate division KSB1 bacterium]
MRFGRLLAVILLLIFPGSCRDQGGETEGERYRFIFIAHSAAISFWVPVQKGMNDAADMLGVDCQFIGPTEFDISEQRSMLESAIESGVDGIATTLPDPEAFDAAVQTALDRGIPVVCFNTDDPTSNPRLSAVVQDNFTAGEALGLKIASLVPSGSQIALLTEAPGHSALEDRLRGAQRILDEKDISYKVLNTTTDLIKGMGVVESYLTANPEVAGFFGVSAMSTASPGQVLRQQDLGGKIKAGGFDLVPMTMESIRDGYLQFTIDQHPYIQGYYAVCQLYFNLRYGISPSDIDTGVGFIDADNVDDISRLTEEGYR